jgi:hypothetical protein
VTRHEKDIKIKWRLEFAHWISSKPESQTSTDAIWFAYEAMHLINHNKFININIILESGVQQKPSFLWKNILTVQKLYCMGCINRVQLECHLDVKRHWNICCILVKWHMYFKSFFFNIKKNIVTNTGQTKNSKPFC